MRPNRDIHFLAVTRERDVARPVASTVKTSTTGKIWNDCFFRCTRLEVPIAISKPNHRVGIRDINPLWLGTGRIKSDAERLAQFTGKNCLCLCRALLACAAKHYYVAMSALGHKEVTVWRRSDQTWVVQTRGVLLNFESRRRLRPGVFWARN